MMMKEDIKKFERLKKIGEISILPSLSPILNLSSAEDSWCQDHSKTIVACFNPPFARVADRQVDGRIALTKISWAFIS